MYFNLGEQRRNKIYLFLFFSNLKHFDEQFDKLESRFRYFEKLIKCFTKDSMQHLSNLKARNNLFIS